LIFYIIDSEAELNKTVKENEQQTSRVNDDKC
jgi:hypothetical protein